MKSKLTPWLILLATLALVLSACGATGQAPAGEGEAPAEEAPAAEGAPQPTEAIEFEQEAQEGQKVLVWMVRNSLVENRWEKEVVLPAWQQEHPDIFIQVLSINQDDIAVKREAMIAAGEPLHVWSTNWGGDGFASDRHRGLLTDLTPLIERDQLDMSDFIPEVLAIYESEGKQWGIPFLTTGSYIYYNMELFDEAGIEYPPTDWNDKSWTWDRFVEVAKQLTKNPDDPNTAVYGASTAMLNLEGPPMLFGHFVWPENAYDTGFAESVNVTNEASIQAFQAFHDLVYVHKAAPDPATAQALDQLGGDFASGRVAMKMNGGWGHWVYKDLIDDPAGFCWGAAPMPWGSPDAEIRTVIYTDPWVITRGLEGEELDMAWEFVKFLTSAEQQRAYTEATGTPPVRQSLLKDYYTQYSKCMDPAKVEEAFQGAFSHGRESSNHLLVRWDELNQTWNNLLDPFWTDPNAKAEDYLPEVEQSINDVLQRIIAEEGGS